MEDTVPELPKTLTEKFKEENITPFAILSMLMGTGLIAYVLFVARIGAMGYVGVVGVGSAAMWMPYLMALIYYNTDKGKPISGLIKKLGYADLPAPIPPWVKRAMVAHNNSLENFMLFGLGVFFAMSSGVVEEDLRLPCQLYFIFRCAQPRTPIFMSDTRVVLLTY
jgi:uncharacterized MAPEG superfamily protein